MASDTDASSLPTRPSYVPAPEEFTVGWICALPIERAAAECLLDREYRGHQFGSRYTLGVVGEHDVVIACLPAGVIGTNSAASVANQLQMEFTSIRTRLLVGIGGGVPSPADVRLGDVVISQPQNSHGGVVQYDFGKTGKEGRLNLTGFLNAPPIDLLDAAAKLRALLFENKCLLSDHLTRFSAEFSRERAGPDVLYTAHSEHCANANASVCVDCSPDAIVGRPSRPSDTPIIHFGSIASANQVMKDGVSRDRWSAELGGILCFEMEAAGLMMTFPSLVIRGICDYADQHKNKLWQPYAAATASAAAKEILRLIPALDYVSKKKLDKEIRAIQKEHPTPDPSIDYKKALQLRQPGTGAWLLDSTRYDHWRKHGSNLWLYGIPGCGKTILSAGVIHDLQRTCGQENVSYFYFAFDDSRKQVTELMIRSLVYQLLARRARPSAVRRLSSGHHTSTDDLMEILSELIQDHPYTYIVIDALDECGDRSALVSALETMSGWQMKGLHILVTSRIERDLEDSLGRVVNAEDRICLQDNVVDPDIQAYVRAQLLERRSLKKWQADPVLCKEIEDTTAQGAHGIWATCQLDQIAKCRNRSQLRDALSSLPPNLNAFYDRILQKIEPRDIEYAMRILRWLAFSERPLLVEELAEAVAISVEFDPMFDPEQVLEDAFESLDICSSLVSVSSASDWMCTEWTYGRNTTQQTVSLAHYSVKEFLINHTGLSSAIPNMRETESHEILAMSCIAYLCQFDSIDQKRLEAARLTKYSAHNWVVHSRKGTSKALEEQIINFLLSESFIIFNKIYNIEDPRSPPCLSRPLLEMPTPLVAAVYFRLADIVQSMVSKGVDVNQSRGCLHSALHVAAWLGDLRILEVLLSSGADVNAQGGVNHTALHAAAAQGHARIVTRLLSVKADVNISGGRFESVLRAAVLSRSASIVGQIIEAGADINAQLSNGTVLHTATKRGELEIVLRLLAAGADVDAMDWQFGSVLSTAAYHNHIMIVEALIKAGARLNNEGGECGTALHAAAYRGHDIVVGQLIRAGAHLDMHIQGIGTPLHAAVSSLTVEASARSYTVFRLCDAGADVNAYASAIGFPLHSAAHRGHHDAVRILIYHMADFNVKDHIGMTPIELAKAKGHRRAEKMLRRSVDASRSDQGSDVDVRTTIDGRKYFKNWGRWKHLMERYRDEISDCDKTVMSHIEAINSCL